jgi:CIC family chloride channel protein
MGVVVAVATNAPITAILMVFEMTNDYGADHDVPARLRVADAYEANPQVIGEGATVDQLLEHLGTGDQTEFPVVDSNLMLVGVITIADLARIAKDSRDLAPVLLAADLALPAETVQIGDSLLTVIRKMGVRGTGALPVVDQSSERLIGMVTRAHVLGLYQRALAGDHSGETARPARP